jgi:hypothetical protein
LGYHLPESPAATKDTTGIRVQKISSADQEIDIISGKPGEE